MSRTVVVTGSGSGIGAALTRILRERGDTVIGVDLRGGDIAADLSSPEGREQAVAEVRAAANGPIDGLVTCAGVSNDTILMVTLNFFGSTEFVKALQPDLAASAAPRVVMIGSIAGTQPHDADLVAACLAEDLDAATARGNDIIANGRAYTLYPSGKAAVATWARRTSVEPGWADAGIAINVVAPGVVLTPMTDGLIGDPKMVEVMNKAVPMPLNGHATAENLAEVIAFLASEPNSRMTGQVIYVDGGAEVSTRPNDDF